MEEVILIVVVVIVVFIITRWFWTWYFKINERLKVDEEILIEIKKLNAILIGKKVNGKIMVVDKTEDDEVSQDVMENAIEDENWKKGL
jgi:hypothetical protein